MDITDMKMFWIERRAKLIHSLRIYCNNSSGKVNPEKLRRAADAIESINAVISKMDDHFNEFGSIINSIEEL